jgi:hypothetical protein
VNETFYPSKSAFLTNSVGEVLEKLIELGVRIDLHDQIRFSLMESMPNPRRNDNDLLGFEWQWQLVLVL